MKCTRCKAPAHVALPSHHSGFCKDCFPLFFTKQVETAIRREKMFTFDERILVALSGGKDSLALMLELHLQGYEVTGLHIDLGIPDSLGQSPQKGGGLFRKARPEARSLRDGGGGDCPSRTSRRTSSARSVRSAAR